MRVRAPKRPGTKKQQARIREAVKVSQIEPASARRAIRTGRKISEAAKAANLKRLMNTPAPWENNGKQALDPGLLPHEAQKLAEAGAALVGGAISKATTVNPKDLFGSVKVSFTKVSAIALAHCAFAMMDGARKYGPYNWRAKPVIVSIYIDAAMRHILAFFEGERLASDSKAHHLGHAMACCAILLDAEAHGCLIDDRPNGKAVFSRVLEELSALIKAAQDERKAAEEAKAKAEAGPRPLRRPKKGCRHSWSTVGRPGKPTQLIDVCDFCEGERIWKKRRK